MLAIDHHLNGALPWQLHWQYVVKYFTSHDRIWWNVQSYYQHIMHVKQSRFFPNWVSHTSIQQPCVTKNSKPVNSSFLLVLILLPMQINLVSVWLGCVVFMDTYTQTSRYWFYLLYVHLRTLGPTVFSFFKLIRMIYNKLKQYSLDMDMTRHNS